LSRVYKPLIRVKLVNRGNSAAGEHAVKEPEPRAPELESPRLFGAGVGASRKLTGRLEDLERGVKRAPLKMKEIKEVK
jgi:hypothetical protein